MRKLSEHFTESELTCKCGCGSCEVDPHLLTLAEKVRSVLGDIPMVVTSCVRCPEHNFKVGGSPNSKHMSGMAMDFYPRGMKISVAYKRIMEAYQYGELPELGGIGYYPKQGFIHIDTFHNGNLRRWHG